jgi:hypothetical protein
MHRLGNRMFSPVGVLAAVVAIWGATPLVYYMTMEPLMSHTFSAFAVALLMLFWLDRDTVAREGRAAERRPGRWFVLGILSGLAGIIRYQDALFAGLPLISGTIQAFRNPARFRASIILRGVTIAGFFLLGIALPLGVQLAANRYLYGSVLTTGYAGEAFSNRASPRLLATLFSPHSGLLLWSPILGIALAGLGMLTRRRQWLGILLWVGLVIQWYLVSSWHAPHQGDSFGNRMLLNCAVVFGMGLMAWLDTLRAWPRWHRASLLLFGAFILANAVLAGLYCFRIIGNPY